MPLDVHLFRTGAFRLAYAPVSDSLFRLDEVGWDALALALGGAGEGEIERAIAERHGREAASRCLGELRRTRRDYGLDEPDPLGGVRPLGAADSLAPGGPLGGADPLAPGGLPTGAEWLPSEPENPILKALCLDVAHDCDLGCRYCFAGQGHFGGRRELMPAEVARAAVDFLLARSGDAAHCEIDFFGGEPLLNFDVVRDTVDHARKAGARLGKRVGFTITTNAVTLDADRAAYLNETMDNVVLSLDGRPEVHDRARPFPGGKPSHGAALANILRFVAQRGDRDYWVRGTYTAWNLDFAEDVAYLVRQGVRNISLEPVVGGPRGYALRQDHLQAIAAEYVRLADFLASEAEAGRKVRFFHFIADPDAGPCFAKRVRGCGAGREYMAVTPAGDLYPCHQFVGREDFRAGNVLDRAPLGAAGDGTDGGEPCAVAAAGGQDGGKPCAAAVAGGRSLEVGRLWLGSKPKCRACWARYRCSGGCHANALAASGSLLDPDPIHCDILRARLEAALYLQARLGG